MITSCAPTPFILSNRPSPSRSRSPSMPSAGNLLGTTRMLHPGVFLLPPLRPYTRISVGVLDSCPGQNGQFLPLEATTLSRRNSLGRLPRSVEIITQRPVIGSFRNSGKDSSSTTERAQSHESCAPPLTQLVNCTAIAPMDRQVTAYACAADGIAI